MEKAENVFIDLELATPHVLEQAIADGRRDIVIGPFSQKAPGVTYLALHREPHGLYCGQGHPLFDAPPGTITRAAIEKAFFSVRGYRHFDDLYRADHPRATGHVMQMEGQAMLILSGRFIGFLPRHIGESWARKGLMREIKPQTYRFLSSHFAAYRKSDGDRPLVRSLVRFLTQHVESQVAEHGAEDPVGSEHDRGAQRALSGPTNDNGMFGASTGRWPTVHNS